MNYIDDTKKTVAEIRDAGKYFTVEQSVLKKRRKLLKAVDGVSLRVYEGETVGLVGESGCGKSTLGRLFMRLYKPTFGDVYINGNNISGLNDRDIRSHRNEMQMVFQDPYASLNPRKTIYYSLKSPLDSFNIGNAAERDAAVHEIIGKVGLSAEHLNKYPNELSGGQRQRVVIARAMILNPKFVVCDEPVSALDVSVRAQVLNLMKRLQMETGVSYLFISHDLSVVRYLSDRIIVMYLGKIVEVATKRELFENPVHPYTKALLSAIPIPDVNVKRERIKLGKEMPSPLNPPSGCSFHTRCKYATDECSEWRPELLPVGNPVSGYGRHLAACKYAGRLDMTDTAVEQSI